MKLVISDAKKGKSYSKSVEDSPALLGRKIGDTVDLDEFGLSGFSAKITGGSDKQGFPMRFDLAGSGRKKLFLTLNKKEGVKKRLSRRGNTASIDTAQLNLIVTKFGTKDLDDLIAPSEKAQKKADSIKEAMVKQSLEAAGTQATAEAMSKEEFKKGGKKK